MPANRSRTLEWRRCLKQLCERNGALEIAVSHRGDESIQPHLVWRVRLLGLSETDMLVEQPAALGHAIDIRDGIELIAVLCIGQNRWMFTTTNLEQCELQLSDRKSLPALRLAMPQNVQRCQRRNYYRVETAALSLPQVDIWPLLDPKSVLIAERACQVQAESAGQPTTITGPVKRTDEIMASQEGNDLVMPEVGPKFTAMLVNLGGGGVGLRVRSQDSQALAHHKLFWMRIVLPSELATPICASGKLVHTHMESNHDTYAGMAFDFSFNPMHQRFVVDQICRYIALQQRSQLQRFATQDDDAMVA